MSIHLFYVGIEAISIVLMLIIATQFFLQAPGHKNTWLIAAIVVGAISYILSSRQDYGALIPDPFGVDFGRFFPVLNVLRNATTAFFMLLCHSIFRDGSPAPKALLILLGVQVFLEEPLAWSLGSNWPFAHPLASIFLFEVTPSIIQLTFLGCALFWILNERSADLVVSRRRARTFFLVIYVAQVLLSVAIERVAMSFDLIPWVALYPVHIAIVAIGAATSIAILFSLMSSEKIKAVLYPDVSRLMEPKESSKAPVPRDSTDDDVAKILAALESQRIYRQAGLSVSELAAHLSLPAYRLRLLIHEYMGFRNFNSLLHFYRVREVSEALTDPTQNGVPILTLALSAGYQSINPFNRAFREIKEMTPTEYRRTAQISSTDSSYSTPNSSNETAFE